MRKAISLALVLAVCLMFAGAAFAGENCVKNTSAEKSACASKNTEAKMISADKAGCSASQTAGATTAAADTKHCSKDAATCNMNGKLTAGHCDPSWCTPEECAQWKASCEKYGDKAEIRMISVKGMTCGGCEKSIEATLQKTAGVLEVAKVSHTAGVAIVIVDKNEAKNDVLTSMVTNKGYEAQIMPAVATTTTSTADGAKKSCAATCAKPCDKAGAKSTETKAEDNSTSTPH